jgi:hypothetical protein
MYADTCPTSLGSTATSQHFEYVRLSLSLDFQAWRCGANTIWASDTYYASEGFCGCSAFLLQIFQCKLELSGKFSEVWSCLFVQSGSIFFVENTAKVKNAGFLGMCNHSTCERAREGLPAFIRTW